MEAIRGHLAATGSLSRAVDSSAAYDYEPFLSSTRRFRLEELLAVQQFERHVLTHEQKANEQKAMAAESGSFGK